MAIVKINKIINQLFSKLRNYLSKIFSNLEIIISQTNLKLFKSSLILLMPAINN